MGAPLPRGLTSKARLQNAQVNTLLLRSMDAIAATNPANDAAAMKTLKGSVTRAAAESGQAGLAEKLIAGIAWPIVFVDGVEVTQSIQDMNQSVPLISGKKTVVRAYVNYPPTAKNVRGELVASRSIFGPWVTIPSIGIAKLDPTRTGSTLAQVRSRRANLTYSLNFELPSSLTGTGPLWVRLGRVSGTNGQQLPLFSFFPKQVTFGPGVSLRLRLVRVRYTSGNPAVTYLPTATDQVNIASWLKRAYPINDLQLSVTTVDAAVAAPFQAGTINAQLAAMRAQDRALGTDGRTHYFGLVSDGGFFMRGLASGIPGTPHPSTVASGPTGSNNWGWDNDGSYGDWYTGHELGHTLGRFHAEFCGAGGGAPYPYPDGQLSDATEAFVGLDVGDPGLGFPMSVMPGVEWHDVMTYCSKQWLSSFTYNGIMGRITAEDALGPGTNAGPAPAGGAMTASTMQVHVVAAVNMTKRSAVISSALPLSTVVDHEPAGVPEKKVRNLEVRVVDAAGQVLHTQKAPFLPSACHVEGEDEVGLVDVVVPNVTGAAAIELVLAKTVLDRFEAQGATVATRAVPGMAGAGLAPGSASGGNIMLNWEAPGAGANQRYVVQVSGDGGSSWSTLAAGTAATSLEVDRDDFPGATELQVKITATSGFGQPSISTERIPLT
jgi:hypothetical protein